MTLQEKILYCRKKQSLSQEALAEKIGVSRQAISKWETGEATPEVGKLSLLAKTFDVTVDWLLSEEEPKEQTTSNDKATNSNNRDDYNYSWDEAHGTAYNRGSLYEGRGVFAKIYRLIVKYSWVAGLYIALSGLLVAGVGFGARVMFNTLLGSATEAMDEMTSGMSDMIGYESEADYYEYDQQELKEFEDEVGEIFPEVVDDIKNKLDISDSKEPASVKIPDPTDSVTSSMYSITNGFTSVIIIFGLVIMVVGIVLAIYLKIKSNKDNVKSVY